MPTVKGFWSGELTDAACGQDVVTVWMCVQCGKKNDACFVENSKRSRAESGERVEVRSIRKRGVSVKKLGQADKLGPC